MFVTMFVPGFRPPTTFGDMYAYQPGERTSPHPPQQSGGGLEATSSRVAARKTALPRHMGNTYALYQDRRRSTRRRKQCCSNAHLADCKNR